MISYAFRLLLAVSLALPTTVFAYGDGYDSSSRLRINGSTGGASSGWSSGSNSGGQISAATTNAVIKLLTSGVRGCQRLDKVYRYDCYGQVYGQAAGQLAGNAAYEQARIILSDVERSLSRTVRRNQDRRAPQVRMGSQQFRAIRADALPAAKTEFIAALEQAETRLLRSSAGAGDHHIRIAAALNSNKLLLRSALLILRLVV